MESRQPIIETDMQNEPEVSKIIDAAMRRFAASRPVPATVTVAQAAEMLNVSVRTVTRRNPPRVDRNHIPYSWVLKQLEG